MKLTLKRATIAGSAKVEDKICFEDDSPLQVQYSISPSEIEGFSLPSELPGGLIRPVVSSDVKISYPLIEALCRQIFVSDSEDS